MNQADIFVTEPAEHDIDEIEYYIGVNLYNKSAAENTVDGIISEILELGNYPLKHPPVKDELLAALGIRMTWFKNYNIFYVYDEHKNSVHVLRVLYNRIDWQNLLK